MGRRYVLLGTAIFPVSKSVIVTDKNVVRRSNRILCACAYT